jgi:hypothetical protein
VQPLVVRADAAVAADGSLRGRDDELDNGPLGHGPVLPVGVVGIVVGCPGTASLPQDRVTRIHAQVPAVNPGRAARAQRQQRRAPEAKDSSSGDAWAIPSRNGPDYDS